MVQSKEYYLANLDRDSHSSGYEHFVSNTSIQYSLILTALANLNYQGFLKALRKIVGGNRRPENIMGTYFQL